MQLLVCCNQDIKSTHVSMESRQLLLQLLGILGSIFLPAQSPCNSCFQEQDVAVSEQKVYAFEDT